MAVTRGLVQRPWGQHVLNEWTGAHISTTGRHTELLEGYEEVQDHSAQNEVLKLFTVHHTSLFIQSGLGDEELGRMAIKCHYAVHCLWGSVAMCGPQERASGAAVNSMYRRDNPLNLNRTAQTNPMTIGKWATNMRSWKSRTTTCGMKGSVSSRG